MDKKLKQNKQTFKLSETKKCNSFCEKKKKKIEEAVPPESFVNCKSVLQTELKMLMLFTLHNV